MASSKPATLRRTTGESACKGRVPASGGVAAPASGRGPVIGVDVGVLGGSSTAASTDAPGLAGTHAEVVSGGSAASAPRRMNRNVLCGVRDLGAARDGHPPTGTGTGTATGRPRARARAWGARDATGYLPASAAGAAPGTPVVAMRARTLA